MEQPPCACRLHLGVGDNLPYTSVEFGEYLSRIGLSPSDIDGPTLQSLHALVQAHVFRIPFENIDVLIKQPIRLDSGTLHRKMVVHGRGGYCMEHSSYMKVVLEFIGFRDVTFLGARVLFTPEVQPRTHIILRVPLHGEQFLVDLSLIHI